MKNPGCKRILFYGGGISIGLLLIAALIIPTLGRVSSSAPRSRDSSSLRQLGQASLIYAYNNNERLPEAVDVWDYARILAEAGIINDRRFWQSLIDPATTQTARDELEIVLPATGNTPRELNPAFRAIKPTWAVALGKLPLTNPATTPIIWTRGLQPDGTWAKHSPYGADGGYILFLGGNVVFYRNLFDDGGQLIDREGNRTANILDALPTGVRVGEYSPTPEESKAWSSAAREYYHYEARRRFPWPAVGFGLVIWLPFVGISIYRFRTKRMGVFSILIWPMLITLLWMIIVPTVSS